MNSALQLWLEHFGISVSAITGVLAARGKRIDLFGVLVLALVTAFGGGTVRDVLVDEPVAWLHTPPFLLNATVTAVAAFFVARLRDLPRGVLLVADACSLALFTLLGTRKGVALGFPPPVAVLLGVVTGVAGGILRDVLTGEVPLVFQPQIRLYATAAMLGAAAFAALNAAGLAESLSTFTAMTVVLALRLAGIWWKISLPVLQAHPGRSVSSRDPAA